MRIPLCENFSVIFCSLMYIGNAQPLWPETQSCEYDKFESHFRPNKIIFLQKLLKVQWE